MPAKSKKQYRFIQAMRAKYKSKDKAPEKFKWVFDQEWTSDVKYKELPENNSYKKLDIKEYKKIFESKIKFKGTCDRIRKTSKGEDFWQDMMKNKKEISEKEFLNKIDISPILDEDETWQDYKETLDDVKFYKSNNNVYFFQTQGFEFIWSNK